MHGSLAAPLPRCKALILESLLWRANQSTCCHNSGRAYDTGQGMRSSQAVFRSTLCCSTAMLLSAVVVGGAALAALRNCAAMQSRLWEAHMTMDPPLRAIL